MSKFKILLVDDEEEFVRTLGERLEMRGMGPDTAFTGEQALQKIAEEEPDIMILDIKMPGIDGMEVLRRVRKAYPRIQVIMLTAHGTDKDEEEAKRLGAFAYLRKPVDLELLTKTIRGAAKRLEALSMASAFAEAGDVETAKKIMDEAKGRVK
ncbi:MAG: response regulator [Deltaproteobacteria bacterium]|nr:response regulator [Deltaproteobacteria bacterium]